MKRTFLYSVVLAILVLAITSLAGCKKENDLVKSQAKKTLEPKEIGYYHNKYITMLLNSKDYPNENMTFEECIEYFGSLLIEDGYDSLEVIAAVEDIKDLNESGIFGVNFNVLTNQSSFTSETTMSLINNYLTTQCNASERFCQVILQLMDYQSFSSDEALLSYANSQLDESNWTGQDVTLATVSKSILNNSYELWKDKFEDADNNNKAPRPGAFAYIYFNDALGGLLGMPAGIFGCLVLGGLLSWATYMEVIGHPIIK